MLRLRIPKCLLNMEASTTVQHVHLGHTPTMCSHLLGVIHSSLQHSWSMLTVVVNPDLLMGIFTSRINRPHPDQLLSWQHIHHHYYCDLFSLSICNNIRQYWSKSFALILTANGKVLETLIFLTLVEDLSHQKVQCQQDLLLVKPKQPSFTPCSTTISANGQDVRRFVKIFNNLCIT